MGSTRHHDETQEVGQSGLETKDESEELLIGDLDPAIAVCVVCFEGVCQCLGDSGENSSYQLQPVSTNTLCQSDSPTSPLLYLYHNTALDEVIKGHCSCSCSIKFAYEQIIETVRQTVAEACHCYRQSRRQQVLSWTVPLPGSYSQAQHKATATQLSMDWFLPVFSSFLSMLPELSRS